VEATSVIARIVKLGSVIGVALLQPLQRPPQQLLRQVPLVGQYLQMLVALPILLLVQHVKVLLLVIAALQTDGYTYKMINDSVVLAQHIAVLDAKVHLVPVALLQSLQRPPQQLLLQVPLVGQYLKMLVALPILLLVQHVKVLLLVIAALQTDGYTYKMINDSVVLMQHPFAVLDVKVHLVPVALLQSQVLQSQLLQTQIIIR
jgi:hypothetical protein